MHLRLSGNCHFSQGICHQCTGWLCQVFVKIAEEGRRHRALLVDMGDESAKLKFLHGGHGVTPGPKGVGFVSASAGFGKVVGILLNTNGIFWPFYDVLDRWLIWRWIDKTPSPILVPQWNIWSWDFVPLSQHCFVFGIPTTLKTLQRGLSILKRQHLF